MIKKSKAILLAVSILVGVTSSTNGIPNVNKDPAYIATVCAGLIMTGGGIYWLVKNPKNKREGFFKRTIRTVCAVSLAAGGIGLIFASKPLHKKIAAGDGIDVDAVWHTLQDEASGLYDQAARHLSDLWNKYKRYKPLL